ncbi:uncharacterized protein LOC116015094 isoform X1 [Ipomoea triloba]|uniref:uncharacterized protein LOC116015094 isoform X1 n=1 Tax=Ipomoea triloba TaxID=35885 RepID=UPI00125E72A7|nr:uncharacterized protein LOC116015094 isoform X1 [Ipomoea triloba]
MSNSGGFAVSRSHGGDRFYSPPAIRRQHEQMLLQQQQQQFQRLQQQQLQRTVKVEAAAEVGNRIDLDESGTALSKQSVVCSSSPTGPPTNATNLDRLLESVTPFVSAQHNSELNVRGRRTREADANAYFCLEDLWEFFSEWSAYGVGVPLLLEGKDRIIQYYVPFLSGIQLYIDPSKSSSCFRRPGEENDEEPREISGGSSNCEADRQCKSAADVQLNRILSRDKPGMCLSGDEGENGKSNGQLLFEYLEQEQPHHRRPLADKIAILASQFPELKKCRSCDLMPSSWISVAWYPIYRIPIGHTLRDLDASFLTFHPLSTQPIGTVTPQHCGARDGKVCSMVDAASKISLPAFGLASYKLKGSLLSPCGQHESEQENTLLQVADSWLGKLKVILPDYQFFLSHYSQRR